MENIFKFHSQYFRLKIFGYSRTNDSLRNMMLCAKLLQSCLTLCNPVGHSPPGSSVPEILQARILEWVAMPSSRGSSQARDCICVSCLPALAGGFFITSATWKASKKHHQSFHELDVKTTSRIILGLACRFSGGPHSKESAWNAGNVESIPWSGRTLWRRKQKPIPVFLPGKSHGQRSMMGYST